MPLIYQKWITRADLKSNPDKLYVFGDNVKKQGYGGQAREMRGEPNAFGIPTKWHPMMTPKAFFWDHQRNEILTILEPAYQHLIQQLEQGKTIVWPEDNIGTGLSRMNVYAPMLWAEMDKIRTDILEKL